MTPPLSVNVFTAPEKAVIGERPRPFGPPMAWDPMTSTLIFGENDGVLVDTLTTIAEAEALADWVGLHHRNLTTIYITHGHIDHFAGLSVLLQRFPDARAIATPRSVELMRTQPPRLPVYRKLFARQLPPAITLPEPYDEDAFTLEGHELRIIKQGRTDAADSTSLHVPVDRPRRRRRRPLQPVPHVRRRHHSRKPRELDRRARPSGGVEPEDRRRRPQEAWRPGHTCGHRGDQALPPRLRSTPGNHHQRP